MKKAAPERHYESAQEEFARRVKELYALAEKMGFQLTVSVKRKRDQVATETQSHRERQPGED